MKIIKIAILSSLTFLATHVFAGTQTGISPIPASKTDRFDEFKQRLMVRGENEIDLLKPL